MNYKIEKLPDLRIIKVIVDGTLDQDTRKEIHLKAVGELTINGYDRLLIDVCNSTLPPNYMIGDSLDMISYMKKFEGHKNKKIAFLFTSGESPRKTFVNTAQLWGINIMHFSNQDEAINWLCQG